MKEKGRKNWKEKQYKEKEEGKDGMFMYTYIYIYIYPQAERKSIFDLVLARNSDE